MDKFTIILSPVGLKDSKLALAIEEFLESKFNASVSIERKVGMGHLINFFNEERGQVNAESLLKDLQKKIPSNPLTRIILIMDVDAYVEGLNFIFGIASEGWGGIVFLRRLHPEFYGLPSHHALFRARVVKEAMHELGHSLGLAHCLERTCVMRFSNSVWEVDSKLSEFCSKCKLIIERVYPGLLRSM